MANETKTYVPMHGDVYKSANAGYSDEMLIEMGFEQHKSKLHPGRVIWLRECPNCVKRGADGELLPTCKPGFYKLTGRVGQLAGKVKWPKCFQCASNGKGFQTPADVRRFQNNSYYKQVQGDHNRSNIESFFGKRVTPKRTPIEDSPNAFPMPDDMSFSEVVEQLREEAAK